MKNPALYKKWSGWLRRIYDQQIRQLLIHRHIFKQLQGCAAQHVVESDGV